MALAMNNGGRGGLMPAPRTHLAGVVCTWLGRALAGLLLVVWGAFFIEHLNQWFIHAPEGYPPAWVWVAMLLHLGMLVGLLLMLRWERTGAAITGLATLGFLFYVGLEWEHIPWVVLINLAPIAVMLGARLMRGRSTPAVKTS